MLLHLADKQFLILNIFLTLLHIESFKLVCFVSDELIELKTELAGDTLDGIRDDEMNVALNNIFQSKYDPHQVIKSVKMQFISLNL